MTAARVGFLPANSSPLTMRSAPAHASYCPKLGKSALVKSRVLLHGRLHLFRSCVRQDPGTVERIEIVTLKGAPGGRVHDIRLVAGCEEDGLELDPGLLQRFGQGVVGVAVERGHERVHMILLGDQCVTGEIDASEGN